MKDVWLKKSLPVPMTGLTHELQDNRAGLFESQLN